MHQHHTLQRRCLLKVAGLELAGHLEVITCTPLIMKPLGHLQGTICLWLHKSTKFGFDSIVLLNNGLHSGGGISATMKHLVICL